LTKDACVSHQYWHVEGGGHCEDCPDGKEPTEDRLDCQDETTGGLTEAEWAAIGGAIAVVTALFGVIAAMRGWCVSSNQGGLVASPVASPVADIA
jgi:hypothetical protein